MIFVTQGHEKAIGLEVFLRSFVLLGLSQQQEFTLIALKKTLSKNLDLLGYSYSFKEGRVAYNGVRLNFIDPEKEELPQSSECLSRAIDLLKEEDILLTLPTSKDQLILNGTVCKGYTEYLRSQFNNKNLCMLFKAFNQNTLLITDHIPLKEVSKTINKELIKSKILTTISYYKKYFNKLDEIIISGINPHCGEGGLLGSEDKCVYEAAKDLSLKIKVIGPVSGDTLHFHKNRLMNQLNVYMYHDQGLPSFKNENKTIGLNITLGLPFIRMSVDHGTAFDIFGKGIADYTGCYYMLKEALKIG